MTEIQLIHLLVQAVVAEATACPVLLQQPVKDLPVVQDNNLAPAAAVVRHPPVQMLIQVQEAMEHRRIAHISLL
jgi:hypothetical protein